MRGGDAEACANLPDRRGEGKREGLREKEKATMRVAVTGGRGRLGTYVVAALCGERHDIRVLDRTPPDDGAACIIVARGRGLWHSFGIVSRPTLSGVSECVCLWPPTLPGA